MACLGADCIELPLIPLECGRCYIITGTLVSTSGSSNFAWSIGNTYEGTLFPVVSGLGDFSQSFEYTGDILYETIYIENTNAPVIDNLELKLSEECAEEYCSECFSLEDEQCCSGEYLTLQWTNNDDGFGFNYTSMPLVHSLTIKGGLRNADYPYDEDYFNTSSGRFFPVYVDAVKTQEMWVERIPEYIHDALRLGVVHDEFTINGQTYSKAEGGYSPDWDTPNSFLAPVIVKVRKRTQNTKNVNC